MCDPRVRWDANCFWKQTRNTFLRLKSARRNMCRPLFNLKENLKKMCWSCLKILGGGHWWKFQGVSWQKKTVEHTIQYELSRKLLGETFILNSRTQIVCKIFLFAEEAHRLKKPDWAKMNTKDDRFQTVEMAQRPMNRKKSAPHRQIRMKSGKSRKWKYKRIYLIFNPSTSNCRCLASERLAPIGRRKNREKNIFIIYML